MGGPRSAPYQVVDFEGLSKSPIMRFQNTLHATPSLVPLIVLIIAISIFTATLGTRFLPELTLVVLAVFLASMLRAIAWGRLSVRSTSRRSVSSPATSSASWA